MYCAYVTKLKNFRPHPNADKLKLADAFGITVIVGIDQPENDLVIYFPVEGQLSEEYCAYNDLVRRKDENGNQIGGYLEPDKRNIKPLKLRGERSEGLVMPLASLNYLGNFSFKEGDQITVIDGHEICKKYVPRGSHRRNGGNSNQKKKAKEETEFYIFPEHIDTNQLKFYTDRFKIGDLITITEKLEGTSHRSALLKVTKRNNWLRNLLHLPEKTYYKDFCGSRRVTIQPNSQGYYGSNEFREKVHQMLVPHLSLGMEVFGEIVGWAAPGEAPLMGTVKTEKLNDKEFTKKYGKEMTFNYGCEPGTFDFYVYRICEMDDDGDVRIEYSTDQIINWCEKHGFKYVPVLYKGFITEEEEVINLAAKYNDGQSTLGAHWREGCVIRRENNVNRFDVYKDKNWIYKFLKGLAVEEMAATGELDNMADDMIEEL